VEDYLQKKNPLISHKTNTTHYFSSIRWKNKKVFLIPRCLKRKPNQHEQKKRSSLASSPSGKIAFCFVLFFFLQLVAESRSLTLTDDGKLWIKLAVRDHKPWALEP